MAEILKIKGLTLACLLLASWLPAFAAHTTLETAPVVSPEQIPGAQRVDAEGLLDLYGQFSNLVIIDARIESDRKNGFIEYSVSLPNTLTDCQALQHLIPSLHHPVAFYCNGPRCGRSAKSAAIAIHCGYDQVYWFRGGIEAWTAGQYPLVR
ncbi:MAG TPA: rhodanese-like domain-containing protein [Gammaproteobacteria bacterium]|nr:rhodanese-like domain-containing protein [Gammaproteobacteria bacterium]